MNNLLSYVSTDKITFLINLDKTINVNKSGKYLHYKMFRLDKFNIDNFLSNLDPDKLYMFIPLITINAEISKPYLTLSRQILCSTQSNSSTISNFLNSQLDSFFEEFKIDKFEDDYYYTIFKYKAISLDERTFK
jgi:hypothetical protein